MTVTPSPSVPASRTTAGTLNDTRPGGELAAAGDAWAGAAEAAGFLVVDSCHSTWLFDVTEKRFRRILKGLDVDPALAATDWRTYERLEMADDSEAFVVVLNEAATRRIRSWRHVEGCEQCEGERTMELSVEDIRRLAHA
ncbi:MAG: hypothetical protein ABSD78_15345 [Acidimicrobiales bacterium]|jgi:hypothetical protein